ncbi:MAG: alpha/beta hydrolase [Dolichospermum sp.]
MTGDWGLGTGKINNPITNYQLPITNYQLPITNYQSPITNHQFPFYLRFTKGT